MDLCRFVCFLCCSLYFVTEISSEQVKIFGTEYEDLIPDEYLVTINTKKLKTDVKTYKATKESTAKEMEDYLFDNVPNINRTRMGSLIFPNYVVILVSLEPQYVHLIQEHPKVSFIETNHKIGIYNNSGNGTTSDSLNVTGSVTLNDRTCLLQDTGRTLWGLSRISSRNKVTRVSQYMYVESDGEDVDIYIMDTGIKFDHEDFGGRAVHGFISPYIEEGPEDLHGHGTHISGTAGGKIHGVAKQANLISVKILDKDGKGDYFDIMTGLSWVYRDIERKQAVKGRRAKSVVNMSLGGGRNSIEPNVETTMLDIASEFGVTFVTAAGNKGEDACYYSPARLSWTITVGSTDKNDVRSDFSNYGPCVDILAPGTEIKSAWISNNEDAEISSGTSMATPHVTGVIARYLSRLCEMPSPAAVKAWLLNAATQDAIDVDGNTPNKLLHMPCFWDDKSIEAGSIVIQEQDFRYDIILFTLILGFGVLLIFAIGATALGYATYKTLKKNQPISDVPIKRSKSNKYKVTHSDNLGFVSDDEVDRVQNTDTTPSSECNNGIAVITQNLNHSNP